MAVWRCLALVATLALLVGTGHCYDDDLGDSCPVSALTFNAALTPLVKFYDQRREAIPTALLRPEVTEADVVCLQEIWYEDDLNDILEKVKGTFPYHYTPIHYKIGELRKPTSWWDKPFWFETVPCNAWKFMKFLGCYAYYCATAADDQKCMVENCHDHSKALSDECRTCISVSSLDAWTTMHKCATYANPLKEYNRVNPTGLVVLSKSEMSGARYHKYHNGTMVERGYIEAQVKDGFTYFCTHLSAVMSTYYEVNTDFPNYVAMQDEEISQLHSRTSQVGTHVLLGDLNTGPERTHPRPGQDALVGEAPASYSRLTQDLGYLNPYLNMEGKCTYCDDNAILVAENKTYYGNMVIDHVLLSRDFPGDFVDAKRVLVHGNLSDHYGVRMDLDPCALAP